MLQYWQCFVALTLLRLLQCFPWQKFPFWGPIVCLSIFSLHPIIPSTINTCHDSSLIRFLHLFIPRIGVRNPQLKSIQRSRGADFVNNLGTHWNGRPLLVSSPCGAAASHPGLTHLIYSASSSTPTPTPTPTPAPTPASSPAPGFNSFSIEKSWLNRWKKNNLLLLLLLLLPWDPSLSFSAFAFSSSLICEKSASKIE